MFRLHSSTVVSGASKPRRRMYDRNKLGLLRREDVLSSAHNLRAPGSIYLSCAGSGGKRPPAPLWGTFEGPARGMPCCTPRRRHGRGMRNIRLGPIEIPGHKHTPERSSSCMNLPLKSVSVLS